MIKSRVFSVPYKFAQQIAEDNLQREFAVWMKLKTLFLKHTIIHDFTYAKASRLSGISYSTLKKYLTKLEELGWVECKNGHVLLKAFKKVCGSRSKISGYINVTPSMTFNQVLDEVRGLSIQRDYSQQKFRIQLTSGRLKAKASVQTKLLKKYGYRLREDDDSILTSTRRVSQQTNLSQAGAFRLMKRLHKRKVICLTPCREVIKTNCEYHPHEHTDSGYVTWRDGTLSLNRGTRIRA